MRRQGRSKERNGGRRAYCEGANIHIILSSSILAYMRCCRVCFAEFIYIKERSRGSRRRRRGGGVVALGPIWCYCDGAFEGYYKEEDSTKKERMSRRSTSSYLTTVPSTSFRSTK
jgi:hypothetical protein